jgi:hypothetical protein
MLHKKGFTKLRNPHTKDGSFPPKPQNNRQTKTAKNPDLHTISNNAKFSIISVKASFSLQQLHK